MQYKQLYTHLCIFDCATHFHLNPVLKITSQSTYVTALSVGLRSGKVFLGFKFNNDTWISLKYVDCIGKSYFKDEFFQTL